MCKLWRSLAEEFLYKDVRIADSHTLQNFVAGMRRSAAEEGSEGYGRYIKRLELPMKPTHFKNQTNTLPFRLLPPIYGPLSIRLCDLFQYCSRLEILVRPCLRLDAEDIRFWGSLISAPIEGSRPLCPHLKRLEWRYLNKYDQFYLG